MIESLTPEQEAQLAVYRDKWVAIGTDCRPADRPAAEAAVIKLYKEAKLNPPKEFRWFSSPHAAAHDRAVYYGAKSESDIRSSIISSVNECGYGQHDASWLAFYDYCREVLGLVTETEPLVGLIELAKASGWFIPHEDVCWMADRCSEVHQDERGNLHNMEGPALAFRDGWSLYMVHGVEVPDFVITDPSKITADIVMNETNAEVRRVMLERYPGGLGKFITDVDADIIDVGTKSHPLKGLRDSRLMRIDLEEDEPVVIIELTDSTAQPDGIFKKYHLRVDPKAYDGRAGKEVLAAVASTWRKRDGSLFFKSPEEYRPEMET